MNFEAVLLLLPLMAGMAFGLPLKNEGPKEVRRIAHNPTMDTEFQTRVGDVTYFTQAYDELLREEWEGQNGRRETRNARAQEYRLWPQCTIPYLLDSAYSEKSKRTILQAMAHWEEHTCVRFVEKKSHTDFITVYPGPGCSSFVGRASREQLVSIGGSCFSFEAVVHELGHVIGFYHEHNRPDRDEHINVLHDNIADSFIARLQFRKNSHGTVNLLGVGYDYNSIMHYDKDFFSAHPASLNTLEAHDNNITVGRAVELSEFDIIKTNRLCKCSESVEDHPPRTTVVPEAPTENPGIPPHQFECGEVFEGVESGSFSSPGYGMGYSHNADCEWSIKVKEGFKLVLDVDLDLDFSPGCQDDYLILRETFDRDGYKIGNWCFRDYNVKPFITTNKAYFRFHTDSTNNAEGRKGFQVNFHVEDYNECEAKLCSHGCINYPGSFECTCPPGFYLSADQHTCFDVNECALNKGGCDHSCVNRGGHFYCDCDEGYELLSDGKTCIDGAAKDPCLTAECEHSCVVIKGTALKAMCLCPKGLLVGSDGVTCVDENECETDNGGCEGICTNTAGSYKCSCSDGFVLSGDGHFCKDIDECSDSNGGCQGTCTNTEGSYQCSCEDSLKLAIDGRSCEPHIDFSIIVDISLPPVPAFLCDGELTEQEGSIKTPEWPLTYPVNIECTWTIKAPSECDIHLAFDPSSFGIAGKTTDNCNRDYLRVYNETGALVANICDLQLPDDIVTNGESQLNFFAGPYHGPKRTGFKINYKTICPPTTLPTTAAPTTLAETTAEPTTRLTTSVETTTAPTTSVETTTAPTTALPTKIAPTEVPSRCPYDSLNSSTGVITSPNYPMTYPVNLDLEWRICCPADSSKIKFSFDPNFWLGGQLVRGCPKDWVRVFTGTTRDNDDDSPIHGPFCFSERPEDFEVLSNDALVAFFAAPKHLPSRIGFSLSYMCL